MSAVARSTLTERVADAILDLIVGNGFAVGHSLPSTSELAARFDVSAVVVREAMATLAGRGIVERRQGREPTVAQPGPNVLESILRVRIRQDGIGVGEFHQCRAALEVQSAALAATAAAPADRWAALAPSLERLSASRVPEDVADSDRQFHLALAELSGNPVINLLLASLNTVLREAVADSLRRLIERHGDNAFAFNARMHERVATAVVDGDRPGAIAAMADHFLFWGADFDFGSVGYTARRKRPRPRIRP